MRYDDPQRPQSDVSAVKQMLQVSGSPLPVITLMYPMQNGQENYKVCTSVPDCTQDCDTCDHCQIDTSAGEWGWLACVHAHRSGNKFGTYYGWLRDLGEFQREYMESPEDALRKFFRYNGPEWETTENAPRKNEIVEDIFS